MWNDLPSLVEVHLTTVDHSKNVLIEKAMAILLTFVGTYILKKNVTKKEDGENKFYYCYWDF